MLCTLIVLFSTNLKIKEQKFLNRCVIVYDAIAMRLLTKK